MRALTTGKGIPDARRIHGGTTRNLLEGLGLTYEHTRGDKTAFLLSRAEVIAEVKAKHLRDRI